MRINNNQCTHRLLTVSQKEVVMIILISELQNKCVVSTTKYATMQKAIIFQEITGTTAPSNLSNA